MCDCHTFLLSSLCQNIVCQSLCRLTDRVDIHTIGSRTDHPAQSGGSKLQCTIKTILDLLVITGNCLQFFPCLLIEIRVITPLLIFLSVIHDFPILLICTPCDTYPLCLAQDFSFSPLATFKTNCCMPFYHTLGFLKSFSQKY